VVVGGIDFGLDHPDTVPVGLQFLGHQHRQSGEDPLPHLRLVAEDGDGVVRVDADKSVGDKGFRQGRRLLFFFLTSGQIDTENQAAADHGPGHEEFPPADLGDPVHDGPPLARVSAAR
jgi:hypothetical protein